MMKYDSSFYRMIESASAIEQAALGTLFTWGVTALGAGLVYFIPNASRKMFDVALGFSAGVMLAASYWPSRVFYTLTHSSITKLYLKLQRS